LNVPPAPAAAIQLINTLGEHLERINIVKPELDADQLIQRAQQRTGLDDWGDTAFRPALNELVAALNLQANLSQVGRITAYYNLLDHLCVRLKIIACRANRPEIAEQKVNRPLFILGLPRTGTTILHELITQDPSFRSPATWEVSRPLPPPTAQTYSGDKRIAKVDRLLRVLEKLTPGFQAIHAIGAQLPQECVYILASSFFSEQFSYMYNVPRYQCWLLEQDMTSAYAWHSQFLQHLQTDTAREHWVLKAPAHLGALNYLMAQYPDASVVWTHRRPLHAIASFSSLTCTLRRGFSADSDPIATGTSELEHCAKMVRRGMAARQALDNGQFIDVSFDAICADPISVVSSIYTHLGRELTHEARVSMRQYLRRRPRNLYGEHRYSAEAFGLDPAREEQLYHEYRATYGNYL
jgi:sulfotransferase family protein